MKQNEIDYRMKKAYKQIDSEREPVCQGCGRGGRPLSHSHTISRNRSKNIGRPELIYDPDNIEIMCFGTSKSCHEIWENAPIDDKVKLINFKKMLNFIKVNDRQKYNSLFIAAESIGITIG